VEKQIVHDMREERVHGTKEELRKMFGERVRKAVRPCTHHRFGLPAHPLFIPSRGQMIARRKELFTEHRCRPFLTMAIPPLTQLPVFVGSSMLLSRLSQPPTVFDSEAFLTLTSLAHTDPTAALPIALGLITLVNVESSRWFVSAEGKEREEREQRRNAEKRARGDIVLEPQKIVQSALRVLSVGRILIGAVVPGVSSFILSLSLFRFIFSRKQEILSLRFDADPVGRAIFAECGALLGLIGDLWSLSVLGIRLLGQTKI
jgi:mitochondrial inner membrane protein COX18